MDAWEITMNFYTYTHTRNDTGAVFYVGKGRCKRAHSKQRNSLWRNIVAKHGHMVHVAMSNLTEEDAFEHEKFLILCFKDMGVPLCNMTDGGEGISGLVHSDEARAAISAARTGKKATPETRAKISEANKNRVYTPEARANNAAAQKGKKKTPEHIAAVSAALMGKKLTKEHIAKLSAAKTGKHHSAETRAKMSAARKLFLSKRKLVGNKDGINLCKP
jgi:hypothetical protein